MQEILATFAQVLQSYKNSDNDKNLTMISHELKKKWERNIICAC